MYCLNNSHWFKKIFNNSLKYLLYFENIFSINYNHLNQKTTYFKSFVNFAI